MLQKLEDFFLNKFVGKLIARAAVTVAGFVAGPLIQGKAAQLGFSISVDPQTLEAGGTALAHAAFEWFKARRAANPNSPAVQTDSSKPGA